MAGNEFKVKIIIKGEVSPLVPYVGTYGHTSLHTGHTPLYRSFGLFVPIAWQLGRPLAPVTPCMEKVIKNISAVIKNHIKRLAECARRPYIFLCKRSPLDVKGVSTKIVTREIVTIVRESRAAGRR
jgi:hypothetical protein